MKHAHCNNRKMKKIIKRFLHENDSNINKKERRNLQHKKWVHKKGYIRRRVPKEDLGEVRYLMFCAHHNFKGCNWDEKLCEEKCRLKFMQQGFSPIAALDKWVVETGAALNHVKRTGTYDFNYRIAPPNFSKIAKIIENLSPPE